MIFKSVQVDGFIKKPDQKIKAFLVYGSNDGLQRDTVRRLAKSVCSDLNDAFRVAEINGSDAAADIGRLYGEFNGQSLVGGCRVPAASIKNLRWSNWRKTAPIWGVLPVMRIRTKIFAAFCEEWD